MAHCSLPLWSLMKEKCKELHKLNKDVKLVEPMDLAWTARSFGSLTIPQTRVCESCAEYENVT